jgi:hypothetical protein
MSDPAVNVVPPSTQALRPRVLWTPSLWPRPLRQGLLLHFLLFVIAVWPLWQTTIPALVDYLNHLARLHVLSAYADSPALQQNYRIKWDIIPYLAMEAVVLPLAHLTDIYTAGKIFVILGLFLTVAGVISVQLVTCRRLSVPGYFVYPVLYSVNLGWGFVPFVFSTGVMLCLFAGFLALERASYALRLVYTALAALLLFFAHLITAGFFALLVACAVTAETRWFSRDFFRKGLTFLPAFLPIVALWTQVPPSPALMNITEGWLSLVKFMPFVFNVHYTTGILATLVIVVALYIGWREKVLLIPSPVLRRCLVVTGILALLMPERLLNIGLFGARLPYVWLLLLAAGLSWRPGLSRGRMRGASIAVAILATGFLVRHGMIARDLQVCDARLQEFRNATQVLPVGTTLTATYRMDEAATCGNIHLPEHINALAVIERDVFIPNMFFKFYPVWPAKQLDDPQYVVTLPPQIGDFFPTGEKYLKTAENMRNWRKNFAYIAYFHFGTTVTIPDTVPIHQGSYFTLLQVIPETVGQAQ